MAKRERIMKGLHVLCAGSACLIECMHVLRLPSVALRHSRHYFQLNETFLFLCFILLRLFHNQFLAEHRSNRMAVIVLSPMNHFDAKIAMTQGITITSSQEYSAQHDCIEISLNQKCVWRLNFRHTPTCHRVFTRNS